MDNPDKPAIQDPQDDEKHNTICVDTTIRKHKYRK